jgi:hypothetical protein
MDDDGIEWDPDDCWSPLYLMWRDELREKWREAKPFDFSEFWRRGLPDLWRTD